MAARAASSTPAPAGDPSLPTRREEATMPTVTLRPFTEADLPDVLPWFAHPDQHEFAPDMPARELQLIETMPGTKFRGARILDRRAWVADDATSAPVAFAAAEVYDNPPHLDGDGRPRRPRPSWKGTTAGLVVCVDPARWGRGYGRATLIALASAAELELVDWLEAGIDSDHVASARCAAAAGFRLDSAELDQEGMVTWVRGRQT
jgi:RimJ/RimL family protein N-acetyltransferase